MLIAVARGLPQALLAAHSQLSTQLNDEQVLLVGMGVIAKVLFLQF